MKPPDIRTRSWTMLRRVAGMVVASAVIAAAASAAAPAQLGGLFRKNKDPEFKSFQAPSQRFTVEYPSRDWDVRPGGTGTVVFNQKKGEAAVTIEYEALPRALALSDIDDTTARYEIERIKRQLPRADG